MCTAASTDSSLAKFRGYSQYTALSSEYDGFVLTYNVYVQYIHYGDGWTYI